MTRINRLAVLLIALPLAVSACKKKPAPVVPEPAPQAPPAVVNQPVAAPVDNSAAIADSIRRATEAARATMLQTIYFDYDSDELRSDARATLDDKLRVLNANPQARIRIEGHTDERGSDQYNLALGRRRADQAKRYLSDRGIDASRIETMSFGRERPAASGSNEEAWAQNRRGEFVITAGGNELRAP